MLKTNSSTCIIHAATLAALQLAAVPAESTRDAKLIARAELANLWVQADCWSEGVLLELAEYLENHAYLITGADCFAVFDVDGLADVMDNRNAAIMACRLAGAYRATVRGKTALCNKDAEENHKLVTFDTEFIRDWWAYQTDEMAWVLNLKRDNATTLHG